MKAIITSFSVGKNKCAGNEPKTLNIVADKVGVNPSHSWGMDTILYEKLVRVDLSLASVATARRNVEQEIPNFD
jgi:hypothetical protein